MNISEIMSTRVISASPNETVLNVAKLMSRHNIGAVPIADGGEVRGMVTDRDIVLRCVAVSKDPKTTKVSEIMSLEPKTISPEQSVSEAYRLMSDEQVRRIPVVDNGKLTGFVSLADLTCTRCDAETASAITEISRPG